MSTQVTTEAMAFALWTLFVEDCRERAGQDAMPAFQSYADGSEEPCALVDQENEAAIRRWLHWRADRLLTLASSYALRTSPDSQPEPDPPTERSPEHGEHDD